jgi:hypothetical protein
VRPVGLCQWKITVTPSGIEPATFRPVAQSRSNYSKSIQLHVSAVLKQLHYIISSFFLHFWNIRSDDGCLITAETCSYLDLL